MARDGFKDEAKFTQNPERQNGGSNDFDPPFCLDHLSSPERAGS
jgi:hypothetical protein